MAAAPIWIQASRPKTLPAALTPVAMGIAIAWRDGHFAALPAAAALVGALLIQVATNFANDYFDGVKGTDTEERLGPQRVVQAGLVPAAVMKRAFILTFALAAVVGAYLVLADRATTIDGWILQTTCIHPLIRVSSLTPSRW